MSEFPKAMYKAPGLEDIHGHKLDYRVVADEQEQEDASADGWFLTSGEAVESLIADAKATVARVEENGASSTALPPSGPEAADSAPAMVDADAADTAGAAVVTREDLEAKATELGIKFDGRTSDKKLSALIADKG